jgi:hypothetical protein
MDLSDGWRLAQLAELVWDDPGGPADEAGSAAVSRPDAMPVIPLVDEGVPCVALSYDLLDRADRLTRAGTAIVTISDPELARGAETLRCAVRVHRTDDIDGARFETSTLLLQELAKYPPSRRRLDSILLRREHWWFLPRILLRLEVIDEPQPLAPGTALLGHRQDDALHVTSVRTWQRDGHHVRIETDAALPISGGRAVLLDHGAEPPDLERRWIERIGGELDGPLLRVEHEAVWGRRDRAPTLLQRVRDEWGLERACRAGLRTSGRDD